MTNGNDGQKSPDLSGQSRARAREPLAIAEHGELRAFVAADHELGASLHIERASGGAMGICLDSAQQRELADWLAEGAEPDPRWTQPEPPEGSLQFVTPSGYSELRLLPRVFQPGPKGSWAMLALRAGGRVVEFALSDEWQQQLRAWLAPEVSNTETAATPLPRRRDRVLAEAEGEAPARPTCASCPFWKGNPIDPAPSFGVDDAAYGECRLSAPTATGGLHGPEKTIWPQTKLDDFCGQHPGFRVVIDGDGATLEPWEREGRVPPGYADSWDRTPEQIAKAGTLTWAVAQLGAVASAETGKAVRYWIVPSDDIPTAMTDHQLIQLATKRFTCRHDGISARMDRPGLICEDCGERGESMAGLGNGK